jgi:uncharacterized protein (TIGR02099 family)
MAQVTPHTHPLSPGVGPARRLLHWVKATLGWGIAVLVIGSALAVSMLRFAMPLASYYRGDIQDWLGGVLGTELRIGAMQARWGLGTPILTLEDVELLAADAAGAPLHVDRLEVRLDVWASLRDRFPRLASVGIEGVHLQLQRGTDGRITVRGLNAKGDDGSVDLRWVLTPAFIEVAGVEIEWRDEPLDETWLFSDLDAVVENGAGRHRLSMHAVPDRRLARGLRIGAELTRRGASDAGPLEWDADLYLEARDLHPANWSSRWLRQDTLHRGIDLRLWAQRRAGQWRGVWGEVPRLEVNLPKVELGPHQPHADLPLRFAWQRNTSGWGLQAESTRSTGGVSWRAAAHWTVKPVPRLRVAVDHLPVRVLTNLSVATEAVPESLRGALLQLDPAARSLSARLDMGLSGDGRSADDLHLEGLVQGLSLLPWQGIPGLDEVDVAVAADLHPLDGDPQDRRGRFGLALRGGNLDVPSLFRQPLPLREAQVRLGLERRSGRWRVLVQRCRMSNDDLALSLAGSGREEGDALWVDARLDLERFDLGRLSYYLPARRMHPKGVAWLDRAIVAGRVEHGEAVLVGDLNRFPFRPGEGSLEVTARVSDAILDYTSGWPRLENLEADLRTTERGLAITVGAGSVLDSALRGVEARVDLGKPGRVWLEGSVDMPAEDIPELLLNSPLTPRFGPYVRSLTAEGAARLALELEMPLPIHSGEDVRVQGKLQFRGADLHWQEPKLPLDGVEGALSFSKRGLWGQDIEARIGPVAGRVEVDSRRSGGTLLRFTGVLDQALADRFVSPPWRGRLRGAAEWQAQTELPEVWSAKAKLPIRLHSNLRGLQLDLPAPLGKPAAEARPLRIVTAIREGRLQPIRIGYQGVFDALLRPGSGGIPERGEVVFGSGQAELPTAPGIRVAGELPELDLDAWLRLMGEGEIGFGVASPADAGSSPLRSVDLGIRHLNLMGQALKEVKLKARRAPDAWSLDVDSPRLAGSISLPTSLEADPLRADLQRLYIITKRDGAEGSPVDPRRLPALRLHIQDFRSDGIPFGDLQLDARRDARGIRLERLRMRSDVLAVSATGSWVTDAAGHLSSFDIDFESPEPGRALALLGYADTLKGGKTDGRISGFWRGAPGAFSLQGLNGDVRLHLERGRILGIEPGIGRVLGLLSLQTLPRRLSLEFGDLFKEGLPFDRIDGTFLLEDGNATTHDLRLEGPVATIRADGRIGLTARDYEQVVTVEPPVSDSLSLAGAAGAAAAVSLGAGAAVLLAHRLLESQLDRIGRVRYRLHGSWDKPRLTPLKKAVPAAESGKPGELGALEY